MHRGEHLAHLLLVTTGETGVARSSWQLLVDRRFGSFIVGKTLAFTGVWIHNVVAVVLAWQITGSATWVAVVSVVQFVPQIVLAPIVGPLADRSSRGRLVAYGRLFCIVGSGGLALWIWIVGADAVSIEAILLSTLVVGTGFAVSGPAMQAMVPDLVERSEVGRAVALDSMPTMFGRAAGPAIGALLAAVAGPAVALVVAALGHLVFGAVAAVIARGDAATSAALADGRFRDGLAYIRRNPVVMLLLAGVTAVGMGADPVVTLAPAIAHDLGGSDALVGYLGSAFGIGAVLGSVASTFLGSGVRQSWTPAVGLTILGLGLVVVPFVSSPWAVCACFLVAGVGFTIAFAGCTSLLHRVVPSTMRGRVMALWLIAFMGTRPIAAVFNGVVADAFGTGAALVSLGLAVALTGLLCLPVMLRRSTPAESSSAGS